METILVMNNSCSASEKANVYIFKIMYLNGFSRIKSDLDIGQINKVTNFPYSIQLKQTKYY